MPRKSASFEPDPGTQTLSNCWGVSVLPLGRTSDIEKELVGRASLGTRRRPHFYTRTTQCACPEALSFRVSNPLPLLQTPSPSCSPTDLVRCACRPARSPSKPRLVSFHCSSVVSLYFGWFRSTLVVSFHSQILTLFRIPPFPRHAGGEVRLHRGPRPVPRVRHLPRRQGLTLVHFSAQLEPRLSQENTLNTP